MAYPSLKDKVVIITGASSGIGEGAAVLFAKLGSRLVLSGRNVDNLKKVAQQCQQAGLTQDKILIVVAELCKIEDCQKIIDDSLKRFGQIDVLVNNAGILKHGGIENTSLEDFETVLDVNVKSVFVLTKLAIPHLLKTKGNIVNVSSLSGIRTFPGIIAYTVSKAALDQLTQAVALELAGRGVRVNSVNPAVIITDIHRRAGMSEQVYQEYLENSKAIHPLGRVGTVQDVANAIAYLASDDASFVTGVLLPVDAGLGIACYLEKSKATHPLGRVGTVQDVANAIAYLASDDASFVTGVLLPVDAGRSIACVR